MFSASHMAAHEKNGSSHCGRASDSIRHFRSTPTAGFVYPQRGMKLRAAMLTVAIAVAGCRSSAPVATDAAPLASTVEFDPGPAPKPGGDFRIALYVVAEGSKSGYFARTAQRAPAAVRLVYESRLFDAIGSDFARRDELSSGENPLALTAISTSGKMFASSGRALLSFEGGAWKKVSEDPRRSVVAISPWKQDSLLALVQPNVRSPALYRFEVLGSASPPSPPSVPVQSEIHGMVGLETGEVFVVADGGRVERWAAGSATSIVDTVPALKGHDTLQLGHVSGLRSNDMWVGGHDFDEHSKQRPFIANFDGKAWTAYPSYGVGFIAAMTVGPDGSLWYATDTLYRRFPSGKWASFSLPQPTDVMQQNAWIERDGLRVVGDDDVWLVQRHGYRYIVAHTRPAKGVLDLDDGTRLTFAQADKRWHLPVR